MSTKTYPAPKALSRRSFLQSSVAAGAALALPGAAVAQAEGQLLVWLTGGSDLFCKIHTGLFGNLQRQGGHWGRQYGLRIGSRYRVHASPDRLDHRGQPTLNAEIFARPVTWFPNPIRWANITQLFNRDDFPFLIQFGNSVF